MEAPEQPLMSDRRQMVDLTYPYSGLSETYSYTDQMPQTSRDERNMRSFDIVTGRRRGSQRPGLGLYADKQAINGYYKVDALGQVQRSVNPLTWTQQDPVRESEIEFDLSFGLYVVDKHVDSFGTTWLLNNNGEVIAVNEDGQQVISVGVPYTKTGTDSTTFLLKSLTVDDYGNIFVATGHNASNVSNDEAQIIALELRNDGTYAVAYTIKPGFFPLDIAIYGLDLYVWGYEHSTTDSQCKVRFERYAEYRMDEEPEAEANSSYTKQYSSLTGSVHDGGSYANHAAWGRMAVRFDGVVYCTMTIVDGSQNLHSAHLLRLNPLSPNASAEAFEYGYQGEHTGPANEDHYGDGTAPANVTEAVDHQGYGLDVLVHPEKSNGRYQIWTIGGHVQTVPNELQPHIRLVADDGDALDWANSTNISLDQLPFAATSHWYSSGAPGRHNISASCDDAGRLYVPYGVTGSYSAYSGKSVLVVAADASSVLHSYTQAQLGRGGSIDLVTAVPFATPDYNDSSPTPTTVDTLIVGGQHASSGDDVNGAVQVRLVNPSIAGLQPRRELRTIALSGGNWYKYDSTSVTQIAGATYDRTNRYVHTTTYDGCIYVADGTSIWKYDAKEDTVTRHVATSNGEVPRRSQLIQHWRGRMVAARTEDRPGVWRMSRAGEWDDWDEFPITADSAAAVSSQTSRAGICPDAINAIVPYSDDVLWFGCDNSIWQLSGDPGSQHVFDNVSDEIGMAFGKPWCRDDKGRLWFFGSKGGLYTLAPGGQMEDVASQSVRRRLRSIDLNDYYVQLAYNYVEDGIHVLLFPYDNPQIAVDHYFYCKRSSSWHVDRFGTSDTALQPTAVQVVDGDAPDDRAIHFGCEDGRLRRWGLNSDGQVPYSDEKHDGVAALSPNVAIDSYVLMGPLAPVRDVSEAAFGEFTAVLSSRFAGCNYEFFASDDPEHLGRSVAQGSLSAGRNGTALVRVVGDSVFLRLRNASVGDHWAYEKASIQATYAGLIRRN
jgi:hypothetical protein